MINTEFKSAYSDHLSHLEEKVATAEAVRKVDGTKIPCEDGMADYVLFFSVLPHLLYADTLTYFREAHRCLKPGGLMIFSFLEFQISRHWSIFIASIDRAVAGEHLSPFIDRAAIHPWAAHAGLVVDAIHDGDRPHIPLSEDVVWENGKRMTHFGDLGQSVALPRKR